MTPDRSLTLQGAAQMALDIQTASNLSGVAYSFLEVVQAVNDAAYLEGEGTEWRNSHPIVRLFVDKLASLCGMQGSLGMENFGSAYHECCGLAAAAPALPE